jgi:secreted trypsin-like serine protease
MQLMRRRPRLVLLGALASLVLLGSAQASAQSDGSVQPRIVGGTQVSISTYPWQAAVVYSTAQEPSLNAHQRQFCGGSLITSRIVLTAAHCVFDVDPDCGPNALPGGLPVCSGLNDSGGDGTHKIDPNDVDVVLGRTTLSNSGTGAELGVQSVTYQANYDPDYQGDGVPRFDAAYLVLSSSSIQAPIKIAGTDEGALWDADSVEDISGWGSTSESGFPVDTLRAATVNVIPDSTCTGDYGSDFDASTMVCAGFQSGGVDTCAGDSGGPLEAPLQGGGYRLVGITGWGEGCAEAGFPGVYTRVAGPTMRSLISSDVSALESANGLPAEGIFGSGEQPRTSTPSVPAPTTQAASPRKKCKHIRNKRKRRRCFKRAKARSGSAS